MKYKKLALIGTTALLSVNSVLAGYNNTYTSADLSEVVVDGVAGTGVSILPFVTIIGFALFVWLVRWLITGRRQNSRR